MDSNSASTYHFDRAVRDRLRQVELSRGEARCKVRPMQAERTGGRPS
jgi:hypothetical protein